MKKLLISALVCGSMIASSAAMARPGDDHPGPRSGLTLDSAVLMHAKVTGTVVFDNSLDKKKISKILEEDGFDVRDQGNTLMAVKYYKDQNSKKKAVIIKCKSDRKCEFSNSDRESYGWY